MSDDTKLLGLDLEWTILHTGICGMGFKSYWANV